MSSTPDMPSFSIAEIRRGMRAASDLDASLCEEEWLRCYSYILDWAPGVDLARYDNGSGDHMFLFFLDGGALIKGFDHESSVSLHARDDGQIWPGMYLGLPESFVECVQDASSLADEVTFCYWKTVHCEHWNQGPVEFLNGEDDGAGWLLPQIPLIAESYRDWAQEYYEVELEHSAVQAVFDRYS